MRETLGEGLLVVHRSFAGLLIARLAVIWLADHLRLRIVLAVVLRVDELREALLRDVDKVRGEWDSLSREIGDESESRDCPVQDRAVQLAEYVQQLL